jgi:hypothetical protein
MFIARIKKQLARLSSTRIRLGVALGFAAFLVTPTVAAAQPRWDDQLDLTQVERVLDSERVSDDVDIASYLKEEGLKADFTNQVRLVTLTPSGMKAVFKPGEDRHAEVAAYRASRMLGQRLVPPTVLRTIGGRDGSLQFFVEADRSQPGHPPAPISSTSQVDDANLFRFVMGQWDIGPTNHLIQTNNAQRSLALIDNAGVRSVQQAQYGDFPFVARGYCDEDTDSWDTDFPFKEAKAIHRPTLESLRPDFSRFLPDEEIAKIASENPWSITYAIWRNQIWVQYYKGVSGSSPSHTTNFNPAALAAYSRLDEAALRGIWAEALEVDPRAYSRVIKDTLERRDQVLRAAGYVE